MVLTIRSPLASNQSINQSDSTWLTQLNSSRSPSLTQQSGSAYSTQLTYLWTKEPHQPYFLSILYHVVRTVGRQVEVSYSIDLGHLEESVHTQTNKS
jgi:chloramphenicol O-acetyltransferase